MVGHVLTWNQSLWPRDGRAAGQAGVVASDGMRWRLSPSDPWQPGRVFS